MKRLFIAVDLSGNQEVNKIYSEIKRRLINNKIRWVKPQNMHLTLKFLGSTPSDKVDSIIEITKQTVGKFKKTELLISQIGLFGSSYKPRVIWLGFEENKVLSELGEALKNDFIPLGFPYDRQNFVPHLTFGRINKIESKQYFQSVLNDYKELNLNPIKIKSIFLYESILRKEGPEYRVLNEFRF